MFKKKHTAIEEKIAEIESKLKDLDPTSDEFMKTVRALNELKNSEKSDNDIKMAKKKSRRDSLESVGKLALQGLGVASGVFLGLAVYGFDSIGSPSTSKIAGFVQQTVIKKFMG